MVNPTKIVTALVAGAAVGAILALLFSPESGEENRGSFAEWVKETGIKAGAFASKSVNAVKSLGTQDLTDIPDEVERSLGV